MNFKETVVSLIRRTKNSALVRDSFWSVFGNAVSMVILMLCGIIIARVVGKEMYGQYGTVKNLMTSFASLAAFGLGYSSTKLISSDLTKYKGISIAAPNIVTSISTCIFLLILFFSVPISNFLHKPDFKTFIVYIGVLMFLKALYTVGTGILAGYRMFKRIGLNAIYSSLIMSVICYPLAKLWGLNGALYALIIYQGYAAFLSIYYAYKIDKFKNIYTWSKYKDVLKKTLPISLHEMSFTFSSIAIIMVLLHYSTYSEYALYSISSQWNAIIIVIPTLLMNLTLSYLSKEQTEDSHRLMLKRMLTINLCSTLLPLVTVLICSHLISRLYGDSFIDLVPVLKISVLTTIFTSVALVFQSNLISQGRSWNLAVYRLSRDIIGVIVLIYALNHFRYYNTAVIAVCVELVMYVLYAFFLILDGLVVKKI